MGNGHRVLLVQNHQHLRFLIAQMVDEAVVQASKAGSGIEQNVGYVEGP
jgi:hypothetical protein